MDASLRHLIPSRPPAPAGRAAPRKEAASVARVLVVANCAWNLWHFRLPWLQALQRRGVEVLVASPLDPPDGEGRFARGSRCIERLVELGFPHVPIQLARGAASPGAEGNTIWSLRRTYHRLQPDIVHHIGIKTATWGGLAAALARVPCLISSITGLGHAFLRPGPSGRAVRWVFPRLWRYGVGRVPGSTIFQNQTDWDRFIRQGLVQPSEAVLIAGSGIDLSIFQPPPEPEAAHPNRPVRLLYVGRLLREKGVLELVEAVRQLRTEGVSVELRLVGALDGENPSSIKAERLARWQQEGLVHLVGYLDDVRPEYQQADIVVLPSHREGLSRCLLEAGACGRAAIATDVPGCREVIQEGETGLLVRPHQVKPLAAAIRRLVDDPGLRRQLGQAARRFVAEHFSVERVVEQTLEVYDRLLLPVRG